MENVGGRQSQVNERRDEKVAVRTMLLMQSASRMTRAQMSSKPTVHFDSL